MDRRQFLKTTGAAGVGVGLMSHASPALGVLGASDKLRIAAVGVNSRGAALAGAFASSPNCEVTYICDVDDKAAAKGVKAVVKHGGDPKVVRDFREALDDQSVDAVMIATPDHWHAPATLMAMAAGKSVYVEKPCGHNCAEGEMLIASQAKYPKQVIQMGNQRRSSVVIAEAVAALKEGVIGRAYHGKAWYCRNRGSIGRGKVVPVPRHLDYELWQGPAPRVSYKDNVIHYNWHWFWNWGTGETCNNGTHEIDVCRWALGVDYPTRVTSTALRHKFDDDWEFYDIQTVGMTFPDKKSIVWEGHSVDAMAQYGSDRGAMIFGENGIVKIDPGQYVVMDHKGKAVERVGAAQAGGSTDVKAPTKDLTKNHVINFLESVRGDAKPNSPIDEGHKSVLLCHLGNVAQECGGAVETDPVNGRVVGNAKAQAMWGRAYEKGWEPKV